MKSASISTLALLLCLALSPVARAQTQVGGAPATIDYQGQVLDTAGNPLAPTTPTNYTMQFRIYTQQTAGTIVWAESQIVTVDKGAFSVRLGTGVAIPLGAGTEGTTRDLRLAFNATERFLGLTVTIPGQPTVEITPRLAFLSSPYAMVAHWAKGADTATQANVAKGVTVDAQNPAPSTLGTTTITNFTLAGPGKINGSNFLEFGSAVTDKEINAGKIGYGFMPVSPLNTAIALDIVGAGTTAGTPPNFATGNRKINMYAEGGLRVHGPLNVTGVITGNGSGITGVTATIGADSINNTHLADNAVDMAQLVAAVRQALCPPGTIVAFGGDNAPTGWLICNGASYSQSAYASLFAVIGTRFGNDAGGSSFNVPDFRGRFLRGRDGGTNRDPDRTTRTASILGGAAGDAVGSLQPFALQNHEHGFKDGYFSQSQPNNQSWPGMTFATAPSNWGLNGDIEQSTGEKVWERVGATTSIAAGATTSTETRPANVYVNYIIKY